MIGSDFRVAIIGAGFSGLAAAIALTREGIDFHVFEEAEGLGGTWWKNRYPGAEVDLESHIYSFSFEPHAWNGTHATWDELQSYLEDVARKWRIDQHLTLGERIEAAEWATAERAYRLRSASGADYGPFHAVVSAVGFLNVPLIPPFARSESEFQGVVCHTSTWPDGLSMKGKSVAVVGTGSSAVQIVESAESEAERVSIFQLEPNWLLPKGSRKYSPRERWWNALWPVRTWKRMRLYVDYDLRQRDTQHARVGGAAHSRRAKASRDFLESSLADRPDLIPVATPEFPFEGRRTVVSDTYYPSLKSPKVTLVPHAVTHLTQDGVEDASGARHSFDIVVLATGFDAANYLRGLSIIGRDGLDLHKVWEGEPHAFYGMMVPGFPNFFMMYGPNTNAIPLVSFYEWQARFIAKTIGKMRRTGKHEVEVDARAFAEFNTRIQRQLARTVWSETQSYFKSGTGKVVSQWPFSATAYKWGLRKAQKRDLVYSN